MTVSLRDEDLTAYLDDELDALARRSIDAALQADPALRGRLDVLRIPHDALSSAFDRLTDSAPSMPELPAVRRRQPAHFMPMAALAASLLIGAFVGAMATADRSAPRDWMAYVAAYQALYVTDTLSTVALAESENIDSLNRLGQTLGRDLMPARIAAPLDFRRAQLLGYEGKPLIQLAYLSPKGQPVALCVIRAEESANTAVETTRLEGMSAAHWREDGFAFLLIGGDDDAMIEQAAQRLSIAL